MYPKFVVELNHIREDPDAVKVSQRARGSDEALVDQASKAEAKPPVIGDVA